MKRKSSWVIAVLIPVVIMLLAPANLSAYWTYFFQEAGVGNFNRIELGSLNSIFESPGFYGFYDGSWNSISTWNIDYFNTDHIGASGVTTDNLIFGVTFADTYVETPFSFEFYSYEDQTLRDWTTAYYDGVQTFSYEVHDINEDIVPEPCTMLLLGTGLAGFAAFARRRKR